MPSLRIVYSALVAGLFSLGSTGFAHAAAPDKEENTSSPDEALSAPLPNLPLTPELLQLMLVGDIAAQRGDGVLAAQLWHELAKRTNDPRIARRATELGINSGQLGLALDAAERWNRTDPYSKDAQQLMIGLLIRANRINDVDPYLLALMQSTPREIAPFFMQLHLLWGKNADRNAVLATTTRLAARYPQLPEAHFARSVASANAGKNPEAIADLDQALALRPDWEAAALYKAQLLAGKDPQASLALLKTASAANPMSLALLLAQARLQAEQNQIDAAHATYQRILQQHPENMEAMIGSAITALDLRRLDEARILLEQIIERKPAEPSLFYLYLGQIAEEQRQWQTALDWYKQVNDPQHLEKLNLRLPRVMARAGQREAALQAVAALPVATENQQVSKAQAEAMVWKELGDLNRARTTLSEALRRHPKNADLYYDRSIYADELGDITGAEADLRQNLLLNPDNAAGQNALGYLLTNRSERYAEAEPLIEAALAQEPDNPAFLDSMGWLRLKQGRYAEAAELLQKAWHDSNEPEIGLHLAEALVKLGKTREARGVIEAVQKLDAGNRELAATRERLGL
ncbi:tetratricopeptide repeat protein [Chitinilyticum aquatile]|uniref:tetratricopeptide repeat protein n=1 Tax=Chitinilyticum aquatile TaxID=362520 RepID=UPI00040FC929|nr:tetratricopeptide repeat protein [Chitinilyticum aquatile]